VTRSHTFAIAIVVALLLPAGARAQGAALRFEKAIYGDEKEVPFRAPEGIACSETGALVVADTGNGRLVTFTWKDGVLGGGAPIKLPQLPQPTRLQLDRKGDLLVLDRKARKIGRVGVNRTFAGWLEVSGVSDATAVVPGSFRLDSADNVHLVDLGGRRLLILDPAGKVTKEIPLPADSEITDVAVDSQGKIYLVDSAHAVVWVAEKGAGAFQPLTKSMKDRMSFPVYLAVGRGRLYLVDQNGMGIATLGIDGSFQGRELSLGSSEGYLYYPGQVCIGEEGDMFIADRQNNRVQVFAMKR
jgi:DNA-binding beta-propeller fold protein YncE